MNLLILGEPVSRYATASYRGTHRTHPSYHEDMPADGAINQAFRQFINSSDEGTVLHDLDVARHVVQVFGKAQPHRRFEIVETVCRKESPEVGTVFLGFDLCYGMYESLLVCPLDLAATENREYARYESVKPLLVLMEQHFRKLINTNGLLDQHEDAELLLQCVLAIQSFAPGFWEHDNTVHRLQVLGLY